MLLVSSSNNFHCVLLYAQPLSRYKAIGNRKCTEWPQTDLEHSSVTDILFTLSAYPQGPKFCLFSYTTSCLQDTSLLKYRKCAEWPQTVFENMTVQKALYTVKPLGKSNQCLMFSYRYKFSTMYFRLNTIFWQLSKGHWTQRAGYRVNIGRPSVLRFTHVNTYSGYNPLSYLAWLLFCLYTRLSRCNKV